MNATQQKQQFAFQQAIMAGDEAAGLVYLDWLEDNGRGKKAAKIRKRLEQGGTVKGEVYGDLVGQAHDLLKSQTAINGYYGTYRWGPEGMEGDGFDWLAAKRGYVPTLRRGKALQCRLGRILEALGHRVFWIA